jgi:hypothetical protein
MFSVSTAGSRMHGGDDRMARRRAPQNFRPAPTLQRRSLPLHVQGLACCRRHMWATAPTRPPSIGVWHLHRLLQ